MALGTEMLYREARLLDARDWQGWLALYTADCEYWVPAWKGEHETTSDPDREISMIYYRTGAGLEDRVWRIEKGGAVSATPLPRTAHAITNIELVAAEGDQARFRAVWTTHMFDLLLNTSRAHFGFYHHTLVKTADGVRIKAKKTELLNDFIDTVIDIYGL
jgi:3-phenylpropionate/cinnamic acid dioxygenase small subunit